MNKKAILTVLICLFLGTSPLFAKVNPMNWYQKVGKTIRLLHHALTHKETELDELLAGITQQFKDFESWMITLEHKALLAIKEKYGMSDDLWQKCLRDIENIKKSYKTAMLNAHPEVTHDQAVPTDIKNLLLPIMKQNNLNSQSIQLLMADEKKIKAQPNTVAETIFPLKIIYGKNELIFDTTAPAQIIFFPRILTAPYEKKLTCCAHELQHVISQHGVTEDILLAYLEYYYSVDAVTFKKTNEYQKLCQIHEAQAEILAAITDPDIAHYMKIYRENNHYPGYLYEEHFYCLSTIDTLWKLRGKLKALYC